MSEQPASTVAVSMEVDAGPDVVWALVSDVTRMGELSPETSSCRWLGDAAGPAVGARFVGVNRDGWRRWATLCRVTEAEPGRSFAFDVDFGPVPVASWRYDVEPAATGCVVRESWRDRRPRWVRTLYPWLMGVPDRAEHNRLGMTQTLQALKRAAEANGTADADA